MPNYPNCNPNDPSCITIENANKLLDQNEVIRDNTSSFITRSIIKRKTLFDELERLYPKKESFKKFYNKIFNFFNLKSNIYIFSFNEIQELINETKATHIMIINGSQQQEDTGNEFQIGQSTLIIVPCKESENSKDGEVFISVGNKGREHPQLRYERTIPVNKGKGIEVRII